jgi:hypothetical protein
LNRQPQTQFRRATGNPCFREMAGEHGGAVRQLIYLAFVVAGCVLGETSDPLPGISGARSGLWEGPFDSEEPSRTAHPTSGALARPRDSALNELHDPKGVLRTHQPEEGDQGHRIGGDDPPFAAPCRDGRPTPQGDSPVRRLLQRILMALRAISRRRFALRAFARARPPFLAIAARNFFTARGAVMPPFYLAGRYEHKAAY